MNREDRIKVKRQKQNARKDERKKVIAEVLELIDEMGKENEKCYSEPLQILFLLERCDFKKRVLALKEEE